MSISSSNVKRQIAAGVVRTARLCIAVVIVLMSAVNSASAQCSYEWKEGFNLPGADGPVYAAAVYDDGFGETLYIGGAFANVDGVAAKGIAKWNGTAWSPLPGGLQGFSVAVFAMHVRHIGDQPALIIGGRFQTAGGFLVNNIAQWDGTFWQGFAGGTNGEVHAIEEFEDGDGPSLYIGGKFTLAGSAQAMNIARWDGVSWSPLDTGVTGFVELQVPPVQALTVFDPDADGPAVPNLYVGGNFVFAGGLHSVSLARWDGTQWFRVGPGTHTDGVAGIVEALAVFDADAEGPLPPELCIAGRFNIPYVVPASPNIICWTGAQWKSIGARKLSPGSATARVSGLHVVHDDRGAALLIGGLFDDLAGAAVTNLGRWDGFAAEQVGGNPYQIPPLGRVVLDFDDPVSGDARLLVSGEFTSVGGVSAGRVAEFDGTQWKAMGTGAGLSADHVESLAALDSDGTQTIFAAMVESAGTPVTQFDGTRWRNSDDNLVGDARALFVWPEDVGGRSRLFVAGHLTLLSTNEQVAVLEWNGMNWQELGQGLTGTGERFALFDDGLGDGPCLYVAGSMQLHGTYVYIIRWNGSTWQALPDFQLGYPGAMEVFDDGDGPALFVGGLTGASSLSRWDGRQWSTVEGAPSLPVGATRDGWGWVSDLQVMDFGSGPALYVGGRFTHAGDASAPGIARWDGRSWASLQGGVGALGLAVPYVWSMTAFDDGQGDSLLVIGGFAEAGQISALRIAKWNGERWNALQNGLTITSTPWCVLSTPCPGTEADVLWVGGSFASAGGIPSHNIAQWAPGDLPPRIVSQPDDRTRPPGGTTTFKASIESGAASYQWLHDASPLIDNDRIQGSQTATLTISDLQPGDEGIYEATITNDCGEAMSAPAVLVVAKSCAADITGANGAVDIADFQLVITNWGPCAGCSADITGDGLVNIDDLLAVINQWGPCL